ncbi:uncharacterized protein LOC126802565 [Argentina anserina]|uniref:uncharacterized protein LOC126802565 n=1 Tax=Argentina anserina TaxID=57926 RepID=UPI00217684BF|nr:uncharacterized protein LOC126802565 [Potentilla anserina]
MCELCGEHQETVEHCLLLCPWTKAVWFGSTLCYIPDIASICTLDVWLLAMFKKFSGGDGGISNLFLLVCFHLWEIWKQRCKAVMKKILPDPAATIERIQRSFAEWSVVQPILPEGNMEVGQVVRWLPPPPGFVKVNFDASWNSKHPKCGLGVVIRDEKGVCLVGASRVSSHNSAVEAESMAALVGLHMVADMHHKKVVIEGDCKEIISALMGDSCANWRYVPF